MKTLLRISIVVLLFWDAAISREFKSLIAAHENQAI